MKKKTFVWMVMGLAVIVVIALGFIFVNAGKSQGYRMMQVYQIKGDATIDRETIGVMNAYENLNLISGDKVEIAQESYMRLKVDEDKYVLAEAGSIFQIMAAGSKESGKTEIQLEQGAVTIEVQNKLSDAASFEVTTPNSVMAVRGTVFRISAETDENGEPITRITVLEGTVSVQKKDESGKLSDEQVVGYGNEAIVYKEAQDLQIKILDEISTTELPLEVLEFLQEIAIQRRELSITSDEIKELIDQMENKETETEETEGTETETEVCTVTFIYQGNVFATQTVEQGGKVSKPLLQPSSTGRWNFDFDTPIYEDMQIEFTE